MTGSKEFVTGPGATSGSTAQGNWMTLEVPDEVNRLLLDFLPSGA